MFTCVLAFEAITEVSNTLQTSYNSFIDLQDKLHQNLGRFVCVCGCVCGCGCGCGHVWVCVGVGTDYAFLHVHTSTYVRMFGNLTVLAKIMSQICTCIRIIILWYTITPMYYVFIECVSKGGGLSSLWEHMI